jgi:selenide,water dikinase
MATLNRKAAQVMAAFDISACTDITGFGLLGHVAEMVVGSGHSVRVFAQKVPLIAEALELATMGLIPAGSYKNRDFRKSMISIPETIERSRVDILFDPQTSGGLLIVAKEKQTMDLVAALEKGGIAEAAIIGEVLGNSEEKIEVV